MVKYPLKVLDDNENERDVASWTKFFKRYRFFGKRFKHFVRIDIVANSADNSNESALEWLGFVESKMFILLNMLAKQTEISEIRAFPTSFSNNTHSDLGLLDADIARFEFVETYFFGFNLIGSTYS
jgi:poly(A) polymerase Pap1